LTKKKKEVQAIAAGWVMRQFTGIGMEEKLVKALPPSAGERRGKKHATYPIRSLVLGVEKQMGVHVQRHSVRSCTSSQAGNPRTKTLERETYQLGFELQSIDRRLGSTKT